MPRPKKGPSAGEILSKIVEVEGGLPHLSEIAEHFIDLAGGPRAVAKMLHDEYQSAPEGGIVRQRLLDIITRVWRYGSDTVGKKHDPEEMSDQELNAELQLLLNEVGDGIVAEATKGIGEAGA